MENTRLIVRNIPKHVTEQRLKAHFSQKGEVTDVKIVKTREGQTRKFGFVGYKKLQDAKLAQVYFNKSYLDTSKILVEFALPYGDEKIPRPWSKYSKGSSAFEKKQKKLEEKTNKKNKKKEEKEQKQKQKQKKKDAIDDIFEKNDNNNSTDGTNGGEDKEKLSEFMSVVKKKSKLWENDDNFAGSDQVQSKLDSKLKDDNESDSEEYEDMDQISNNTNQPGADNEENEDDINEDNDDEEQQDDLMEEENKIANDENISDMDYLMRHKKTNFIDTKDEDGDNKDDDEDDNDDDDDDAGGDIEVNLNNKKRKRDDVDDDDNDVDHQQPSSKRIKLDVPDSDESKKPKKLSDQNKNASDDDNEDGSKDGSSSSSSSSSSSDDDDSDNEDGKDEKKKDDNQKKYNEIETPQVSDSGRLFVRNLSFACTEDDLKARFSEYGTISEVHIAIDKETGKSKGIGFVQFDIPMQALEALKEIDGTIFQGRLIHVLPGKQARAKKNANADIEAGQEGNKSKYQQEKDEKLRKDASTAEHTWNPLYIRADAVTSAMAEKYNIEKAELLDPQSSLMAVRQALGETAIITETKQYLIDEGVDINALEGLYKGKGEVSRSQNIILVKNIPYATEPSDIKFMFGKFGSLGRIVLPPTKTMAMIEFLQPSEARLAFSALAYRSFKGVPLFLEWAPVNSFHTPTAASQAEEKETEQVIKSVTDVLQQAEAKKVQEEGSQAQFTLFVKNLNFITTEEDLEKHFQHAGKVRHVTIARTKDMKNEGRMKSLGYGFVEYKSREDALNAFKTLQGGLLDGHSLELAFSKQVQTTSRSTNRKVTSRQNVTTKLHVKNVPFQTNKKELRAMFSPFGEIKSLRIPLKQGGRGHRGFAFIEFVTKEEAKNAMEALSNSHFYGRHLVIDYAAEDDSLEKIREKTKSLYEATNK
eukprot:TRINITY_DN6534_c0_g5_i1.p1 TRINITY_DN6534_c0_g5~~TRINITY_DN6534_c0_g5_i1.p1  ORF type:complete len:926 (-),score=321.38 TRINITY_DN6534_c0_g5_i1:282-3059(-)